MQVAELVHMRNQLARLAGEHKSLRSDVLGLRDECVRLRQEHAQQEARPRSLQDELDAIVGRRIFYNLGGTQRFSDRDAGKRGQPINFLVSQDGPFIMTHYPVVMWRPSEPITAARFGRWRPVTSWPLPDQAINDDVIDLSWELVDGGSQRNFQNLAANPSFSRPDLALPLAVPTLFAPNTTIQFFPTYESISFAPPIAETDATRAGILAVTLPGYRIVNM